MELAWAAVFLASFSRLARAEARSLISCLMVKDRFWNSAVLLSKTPRRAARVDSRSSFSVVRTICRPTSSEWAKKADRGLGRTAGRKNRVKKGGGWVIGTDAGSKPATHTPKSHPRQTSSTAGVRVRPRTTIARWKLTRWWQWRQTRRRERDATGMHRGARPAPETRRFATSFGDDDDDG